MILFFSTHTLNLVFLPKSFRGGGVRPHPHLKGQEGGPVPTCPTDPRLDKTNFITFSGVNYKNKSSLLFPVSEAHDKKNLFTISGVHDNNNCITIIQVHMKRLISSTRAHTQHKSFSISVYSQNTLLFEKIPFESYHFTAILFSFSLRLKLLS